MTSNVLKAHTKGQKRIGKTNWAQLLIDAHKPKIDEENPELVGLKQFKKTKSN